MSASQRPQRLGPLLLTAAASEPAHAQAGDRPRTQTSSLARPASANQDCVALIDGSHPSAVLADGMGGLADGAGASQAAVQAASSILRQGVRPCHPVEAIAQSLQAISAAHEAVQLYGSGLAISCGTTLLQASVTGTDDGGLVHVLLGHAGDSIAVLLEPNRPVRLLAAPHAARDRDGRRTGALLRYVGSPATHLSADITSVHLAPTQAMVLMTDGIWKSLDAESLQRWWTLAHTIRRYVQPDPDSQHEHLGGAARKLLQMAREAGSTDDRSCVVLAHPVMMRASRASLAGLAMRALKGRTSSSLGDAPRAGELLVDGAGDMRIISAPPTPTRHDTQVDLPILSAAGPSGPAQQVKLRLSARMLADLAEEPTSRADARTRATTQLDQPAQTEADPASNSAPNPDPGPAAIPEQMSQHRSTVEQTDRLEPHEHSPCENCREDP